MTTYYLVFGGDPCEVEECGSTYEEAYAAASTREGVSAIFSAASADDVKRYLPEFKKGVRRAREDEEAAPQVARKVGGTGR